MNFTIRKLNSKDWQKYKYIRLQTLLTEPQAFSSKHSDFANRKKDYWINLLDSKNKFYFLAESENTPIGIVSVDLKDEDEAPETAVIGGLYVEKAYRKNKIGALLIDSVINHVKVLDNVKKLRLYVIQNQIAAIHLYKKLGFEPAGEKDGELIMDKSTNISN